jgi:hypothetical protein
MKTPTLIWIGVGAAAALPIVFCAWVCWLQAKADR